MARFFGGNGDDILIGTTKGDRIYGRNGNDLLDGRAGNDRLFAGNGDDTFDGGSGRDRAYGGNGDDTGIYVASENVGTVDLYRGDRGFDTLRLVLTPEENASAAVQADIQEYLDFLDRFANPYRSGGPSFQFESLGLTVRSFEALDVQVLNGAPVAEDDAVSVDEDAILNGDVLTDNGSGADSDPDGDPLTVALVDDVTDGTLFLNSEGTFSYTPDADFNGTDTFTYRANDGAEDSNLATVTITVDAVNDAPSFVIGGDQNTNQGEPAIIVPGFVTGISAGPANESGQTVSFNVTTNNDGLFSELPSIDANGDLTYRVSSTANGAATVTVTAMDDGGTANGGVDTSAAQTFDIAVAPVNDPPVVDLNGNGVGVDFDVDYDEGNGPVSIVDADALVTDTDSQIQSMTVSFSSVDGASELLTADVGASGLTLNQTSNDTLEITGAANASVYQGVLRTASYSNSSENPTPGTRTITVEVNDGENTASATATVTVTPVNDPPVLDLNGLGAGVDFETGIAEGDGPVSIVDPLAQVNDIDSQIQSLTVTLINAQDGVSELIGADVGASGLTLNQISNDTLEITGTASPFVYGGVLQTVTYQNTSGNPTAGARTITVEVDDGDNTASATATVTVTPATVGVAQDGYLSGSTVFADSDGDNTLDGGEVSTKTDVAGNFILVGGSGSLVLTGGIDIATRTPFDGILKAPEDPSVINGITTLIQLALEQDLGLTVATASAAVATNLNLPQTVDLAAFDPIAGVLSGDANDAAAGESLFGSGSQVFNTASLFGALLTGAGGGDVQTTQLAVLSEITAQVLLGLVDLTDPVDLQTILLGAAARVGVDVSATAAGAVAIAEDSNGGVSDAVAATNG